MTATAFDIFDHWLEMDPAVRNACNWGTARDNSIWDVDSGGALLDGKRFGSYINGMILHLDLDYEHGWLLEIVEHETGVVNYLVLVSTPYGRDAFWYDLKPVGTFFDRKVEQQEVAQWALSRMYGSLEALLDAWKKR